jgi:hypothetical protein
VALADDALLERVGERRRPSISFLTMRPTGMPVQSATTEATAWASTLGRISGRSPCRRLQLGLQRLSSLEQGSIARRGRARRLDAESGRRWRLLGSSGLAFAAGAATLGGLLGLPAPPPGRAQLCAQIEDLLDQPLLVGPARSSSAAKALPLHGELLAGGLALGGVDADRGLAAMIASSFSSASMRFLATVLDLGGSACWLMATRRRRCRAG